MAVGVCQFVCKAHQGSEVWVPAETQGDPSLDNPPGSDELFKPGEEFISQGWERLYRSDGQQTWKEFHIARDGFQESKLLILLQLNLKMP